MRFMGDASDHGFVIDQFAGCLNLPDATRMFLCHDYKAPGRDQFVWETSIAEQRNNVHLHGTIEEFVAMREARDAGLAVPAMLIPALQNKHPSGPTPGCPQDPGDLGGYASGQG